MGNGAEKASEGGVKSDYWGNTLLAAAGGVGLILCRLFSLSELLTEMSSTVLFLGVLGLVLEPLRFWWLKLAAFGGIGLILSRAFGMSELLTNISATLFLLGTFESLRFWWLKSRSS
jgi:hypothetical protein